MTGPQSNRRKIYLINPRFQWRFIGFMAVVSLLAISISNLEAHAIVQLELPLGLADEGRRLGTKKGLARSRAGRAVDAIRRRFGGQAVDYGSAMRVVRSVPDEFRRLAERELTKD